MENNNIFFSIIIPVHNEENLITNTCEAIIKRFVEAGIADYEIVCVNIMKPNKYGSVVKLADALDSKSSDSDIVSVRFRPLPPSV